MSPQLVMIGTGHARTREFERWLVCIGSAFDGIFRFMRAAREVAA